MAELLLPQTKAELSRNNANVSVGRAQHVDDGLEGEPLGDVISAAEHLAEFGAGERLLRLHPRDIDDGARGRWGGLERALATTAVSYTHLTLPMKA